MNITHICFKFYFHEQKSIHLSHKSHNHNHANHSVFVEIKKKKKPHGDQWHINIYLPFRKMTSRRSVVTALKDIWEPQVLGKVGVAGLLSGAFGEDPKETLWEEYTKFRETFRFSYRTAFLIL